MKTLFVILFAFFSSHTMAHKAQLAIIIDDMGYQPLSDEVRRLPREVSLSIIPFTEFDKQNAQQAFFQGREVMLHLPMQSAATSHIDPHVLTLQMKYAEFVDRVQAAIAQVPYIIAVNNHMGSVLTEHARPMSWLMHLLQNQRLGFIDSRTSPNTVAQKYAFRHGVANNRRHVFLDHVRSERFITEQFNQAIAEAQKTQKPVVVIGHPHRVTIRSLDKLLAQWRDKIELIPISNTLLRPRFAYLNIANYQPW